MEVKVKELKKLLGAKEINHIEINNMVSNAGNSIPNQYEVSLHTEKGLYKAFYSYNSLIAIKYGWEIIIVGSDYNYSNTTGKYRNAFLNMDLKKLNKFINENMIYNTDLNVWVNKDIENEI